MNEIQTQLRIACDKVGNLRLSAERLRRVAKFKQTNASSLTRWINHPNPPPSTIFKMEYAIKILTPGSKKSSGLTIHQKKLLHEALDEIESLRRRIQALLNVFS